MNSHLPSLLLLVLLLSFFHIYSSHHLSNFPIPHPNPDSVAEQLTSIIHTSHSLFLSNTSHSSSSSSQCLTGNPIDDCWRCTASDWRTDRQHLADCSIGFGQAALGGRNGQTYVVTDSSDSDPANPKPGTLRYAAIQTSPLWITFSSSMKITLASELLISSFKTIDGRGSDVHIADGACLTLRSVSNVIIHNVRIYNCKPARSGFRGRSDGDGISLYGARNIWIDHCDLSNCADGLIDAIMGSTGITISNSYFSHHNEVMLLGHVDDYLPDSGMQVTIAFNRFGPGLVQRMPRCRRGYIHVVNNDYTYWEMYAIGGSANPTINSQGNRYTAPGDQNAKEVTKRVDTDESEWSSWNWRTDGDIMVNGAFFVPSGAGLETKYSKAESVEPKSSAMIDQLTMNAGVLGGDPRRNEGAGPAGYGTGVTYGGAGGGVGGGQYGYDWGMIFGSDASALLNHSVLTTSLGFILLILLTSDFWLL